MKTKKLFIIGLIILLLCFLIPIPKRRNDGGTVEYDAMLYKVIKWHEINPNAIYNEKGQFVKTNEPEYLTGTSFYFFPCNFGVKRYGDK